MRRRRRRWTRKKLVCLLAAWAAAVAAAASDSISGSDKPSIFRTFLFLAHNSLADQNPTTIKNTDLHVTHLAHAHPHPISTVLSRAPAGCGEVGWVAGEGRRPRGRRCILARTPATCADGPSPQPKHRLATGCSRYITSPPPPAQARRPLPLPRGRAS